MRMMLLIRDADNRIHEPIVEVDTGNASFLKLAAINGMQLIGACVEGNEGEESPRFFGNDENRFP